MVNIIISGGSGTRMWPLSRKKMPKQFYPLIEGQSLFEKTVTRNLKVSDKVMVITNEMQYLLAMEQMDNPEEIDFILEPVGRDTAPAIALGCLALDPDTIVLITPADHLLLNETAYKKAIDQAQEFAKEGFLVTFGIQPAYAETGYGYIEANGNDVASFKEKPDAATAEMYINAGNFYWNSGMFCFKAGVFLEELGKYAPAILEASTAAWNAVQKQSPYVIDLDLMLQIPAISIDYGVMEKSAKVKVVPAQMEWNDLGSFDALYDTLLKDDNGNVLSNNSLAVDSRNIFVTGTKRFIAAIDVNDLLIIDTDDALMICSAGSSQKVKHVTNYLAANQSTLAIQHNETTFAWGKSCILHNSAEMLIEKLYIKAGSGKIVMEQDAGHTQITCLDGVVKVDELTLNNLGNTMLKSQSYTIQNISAQLATLLITQHRNA